MLLGVLSGVKGAVRVELGPWILELREWFLDLGSWTGGSRTLDLGKHVRKFLVGFLKTVLKVQKTVNSVYSVNYLFMSLFFIGFSLFFKRKLFSPVYRSIVNFS